MVRRRPKKCEVQISKLTNLYLMLSSKNKNHPSPFILLRNKVLCVVLCQKGDILMHAKYTLSVFEVVTLSDSDSKIIDTFEYLDPYYNNYTNKFVGKKMWKKIIKFCC
eukprot:GHVT01015447.1.p1 GENE.GHVT01015447.1~~GHVT01015447.1.p1  ORF type:complete len:108 (-),score=0.09 GHVT01015447.1:287-610(-)